MRTALTIFAITVFGLSCRASETDSLSRKGSVTYYFSVGMAALQGCEDCKSKGPVTTFSLNTIHGVRIGKRLSVAGGLGYDVYESWNALPMFGVVSWDLFGRRKNRAFLQFEYGYSAAWIRESSQVLNYKSSSGGKMISPLLGYRIHTGTTTITLTMGYKFQRTHSSFAAPMYTYIPYDFTAPPMGERDVQSDMNRFVAGIGVGWK